VVIDPSLGLTESYDTFSNQLRYDWDKSHNLTGLQGNKITSTWYQYGSDNNLINISYDVNQISYHYDECGRLFLVKYPGPYKYKQISYKPDGKVGTILDSGLFQLCYSYYDNGNISGYDNEQFSYDADGRLIYWSKAGRTPENYQYDAAGNLLTKGSRTFAYNSANQITNPGYTYDNNGNLTSDGTYNYIYDAVNKLIEVRYKSNNSLRATYGQ
jgi:YD repeat-containing protein